MSSVVVVATELTIKWNQLEGVYELGSASQMIPFILGSTMLLHTCYRWIKPSKPIKEDSPDPPLILTAAKNGYETLTRLLLLIRVDTEVRDGGRRDAMTPLLWAVKEGHEAIVGLLLHHSANKEAKNGDGETPLSLAFRKQSEAIMLKLLDNGASINVLVGGMTGIMPLSWTFQNKKEAIVLELLDKGANVEEDVDCKTPLSWAITWRNKAVIQKLIEKGANPDNSLYDGETPRSLAIKTGLLDIIGMLPPPNP